MVTWTEHRECWQSDELLSKCTTYQGLAVDEISHGKCSSRHSLLRQLRVEILEEFGLGLGPNTASLFDICACGIVY